MVIHMVELLANVRYKTKEAQQMITLALAVVFTGLVFIGTAMISIALSSTGYFNIGEAFVYIAAIIGGPIVGGIAGAVGSSLADIALGYGIYAPGTFIFKGLEGVVVGFLVQFAYRTNKTLRKVLLGVFFVFIAAFTGYFSKFNIVGSITYSFGKSSNPITFSFPGYVITIIAIVLALIVVFVAFKTDNGELVLSCALGGLIIIIGYFLYQISPIIHAPVVSAAFEIPFNIFQVAIGTAIAIPVVHGLINIGVVTPPKKHKSQKSTELPLKDVTK